MPILPNDRRRSITVKVPLTLTLEVVYTIFLDGVEDNSQDFLDCEINTVNLLATPDAHLILPNLHKYLDDDELEEVKQAVIEEDDDLSGP